MTPHMLEVFNLGDAASRVKFLGTGVRAVHDGVAAIQLVGVVQLFQTLLRHLVARVDDPAIRLLEN